MEMNIEPANYVPVIYKTELEAASITGFLPTILIIGKIWIPELKRKAVDFVFHNLIGVLLF